MASRSYRSGPAQKAADAGTDRTSGGSTLPSYYQPGSRSAHGAKPRAGPNRTSKASGKLKILPEEPEDGMVIGASSSTSYARPLPSSSSAGRPSDSASSSEEDEEEVDDDNDAVDARHRLSMIPEGSMRRDARRLTRKARHRLPRVTAYSTATSYRMRELIRWLQSRRESHGTNVMSFDECVYSTYTYEYVDAARLAGGLSDYPHGGGNAKASRLNGGSNLGAPPRSPAKAFGRTGDLLGIPELRNEDQENDEGEREAGVTNARQPTPATATTALEAREEEERELERQRAREEARIRRRERFVVKGLIPEVFFMEYGTVVIWGMTLAEEKRLLREIRRFEVEKLAPEDVESEDLNWYLADYSRIFNDVITLRKGSSYMTKLSLSHALAQSTKISFFEGVIEDTIDTTKDIPQSIAESGKIGMPPAEIMKQIGHLFILRMNIHLVGSIVDSPEIFWSQPDLEPLYSAARSYLEIPQRIDLLNARVLVLQDLLELLKDQVQTSHSEWLELVVIALIVLEIILGVATMLVDLAFG